MLDHARKEAAAISKHQEKLIKLNLTGKITVEEFSKIRQEFFTKLATLEETIASNMAELDKLNNLKSISDRLNNFYSFDMFKLHAQDAIEYVKVYGIEPKYMKRLGGAYTLPHDVVLIFEVKSRFVWDDESDIFYRFSLSRWTDNIAFPFPTDPDMEFPKAIAKGKFESDFFTSLKDFKAIKSVKNTSIRQRKVKR